MFVHMHNPDNESGQVSAFVRVGTDYTDNYYEIEIPRLVATLSGTQTPEAVWPDANSLDIALQELIDLKASRNNAVWSPDVITLHPANRPMDTTSLPWSVTPI